MGVLYAKEGRIHCNEYMEIYVPMEYFNNKSASNKGVSIETIGIVYTRAFEGGNPGPLRLMNLPIVVNFMLYTFKYESIKVHDKTIDVMTLEYLKDAYVMHQTVPNGREVAEQFLGSILAGKLPRTINYTKVIDMWWRNLEISGVSFKVPSKIFEMIIASIYRSPNEAKDRYGQYFGRQANPSGYDYETADVRGVVKDLSTFTGMVFEDIGTMITNGIVNSEMGNEEPVSPLEKIIHY